MGIKWAGAIYQEIEKMPSCVDTVENAHYSMVVDWCQWSLIGARRIASGRSLEPVAHLHGFHVEGCRPSDKSAFGPLGGQENR